jgi:AcrR family transcriptional regulator
MSRGAQENARVKKDITEAVFVLLKSKEFSEITVTDIVTEAKVARASYYRNFETKETIVEGFIDSIYQELAVTTDGEPNFNTFYSYEMLVQRFEHSLTCLLQKKSYILALYKNGFGSLVLEIMNHYIEEVAGDMPRTSIERYKLYFVAGAAFNVLIKWLEGGAVESPREMAKACAGFIGGGVVAKQ